MNLKNIYKKILIFFCGYNFHHLQNMIGMKNLQEGVDHYAEIHTSYLNCVIHTIFMPYTMFGMFLWIPALLRLNPRKAYILRLNVIIFYIGLYLRISAETTLLVCLHYFNAYIFSVKIYAHYPNLLLRIGLLFSISSLIIQEIIGHYLGGDEPSRLLSIPNAILYAPYYSVSNLP